MLTAAQWVVQTGADRGCGAVWVVQTGEEQHTTPRRHPEGVTCLAAGQHEGMFVSGGRDGMVRVWVSGGQFTRWKQPQVWHNDKVVLAVAVCGAQGEHIASIDDAGRVLVWSLPLAQLLADTPPSRHHPAAAAAMPSAPGMVATGGLDTSVRLWHVSSWEEAAPACWYALRRSG